MNNLMSCRERTFVFNRILLSIEFFSNCIQSWSSLGAVAFETGMVSPQKQKFVACTTTHVCLKRLQIVSNYFVCRLISLPSNIKSRIQINNPFSVRWKCRKTLKSELFFALKQFRQYKYHHDRPLVWHFPFWCSTRAKSNWFSVLISFQSLQT